MIRRKSSSSLFSIKLLQWKAKRSEEERRGERKSNNLFPERIRSIDEELPVDDQMISFSVC